MEYTFSLPRIIKDRGLTQSHVAELTGMSKNGVSNLCRAGLVQIRVDTISKLCAGLGVTPADLFVPIAADWERAK